jgi:hypothetical protein
MQVYPDAAGEGVAAGEPGTLRQRLLRPGHALRQHASPRHGPGQSFNISFAALLFIVLCICTLKYI